MPVTPEQYEISPEEFEQRKAWVQRQPNWLWYWPDVQPAQWRRALESLEAVVRGVLSGQPASLADPDDIKTLSVAGYTSGLGPLLGYWIENGLVDADQTSARIFALHLDHNRRRMSALGGIAHDIVSLLDRQGIAVTVLKGMHTAYAYFPDPATRPVSDIDLLIPRDKRPEAASALAEAGFEMTIQCFKETTWVPIGSRQAPRSLLLGHAEDPWSIDLHHSIDQKPATGASITELDRSVSGYLVSDWQLQSQANTIAQPALLLHLAAHIGAATCFNLSLMRLVELVLVIRSDEKSGKLDWREFVDLAAESRSLHLVFPAFALVQKLMPDTIPPWVLDACTQASTRGVRRMISGLTPTTAHRFDRLSLAEHYMWARGPLGFVRQFGCDLWPDLPLSEILARYRRLCRRALAGAFMR